VATRQMQSDAARRNLKKKRGSTALRLHPTPILLRDPAPLGARAQASAAERRPPTASHAHHIDNFSTIVTAQSANLFETHDYIRPRPGATTVLNRRQVNAQQEQLGLRACRREARGLSSARIHDWGNAFVTQPLFFSTSETKW